MEPLTLASLLAEPAPLCWDRLMATNSDLADQAGQLEDPVTLALPWMVRHMGVAGALAAAMEPEWLDLQPDMRPQGGAAPDAADAAENDPHMLARSAQALPALQRLGHDTRLVRCSAPELAYVPLPAVLILRGGDACVLTGRHKARRGRWILSVVMPGVPPLGFELPLQAVAREYTGMALLTQPNSKHLPQTGVQAETAPAQPAPRQGPLARLFAQLQLALLQPSGGQASGAAKSPGSRRNANRRPDRVAGRRDVSAPPRVKPG